MLFWKTDKEKKEEAKAKEKKPEVKRATRFQVFRKEGCSVTLKIEVPKPAVGQALDKAYLHIQSKAALPGFRAGKAPMNLVQSHFSQEAHRIVVDRFIQEESPEAFKEQGLSPISVPMVHSIDYKPGEHLSFLVDLECAPEFDLAEYKAIPVSLKKAGVTDDMVEARIQDLRERHARLETSPAETLTREHVAVVDYEGTADSKPLEGGRGEGELIDMSAPQTVAGLDEGILGAKRGETREVPVEMQGKKASFKATVKEIKQKVLPNLDDEFSKDLGLGSLAELKVKVREMLEAEQKRKREEDFSKQIEESLLGSNGFPVPKSLVEEQCRHTLDRLKGSLFAGRKLEEKQEEDLKARILPDAERQVRLSYILRKIVEKEGVVVLSHELEEELQGNLQGIASEAERKKVRKIFESRKEDVSAVLLDRKVMKLLRDSAKVEEHE